MKTDAQETASFEIEQPKFHKETFNFSQARLRNIYSKMYNLYF